ncbi:MAG TPA: hypothetical protein VFL82_01675 [Thermomicrobiales bacterium]|jgi:hypothetical protein|nr:hypothetical protein [Thermomicrobiales bacterium]
MDGHRFDEWTKTLATGASRRKVLGGLVGGFVAALGLRGTEARVVCPNAMCAEDPGVCGDSCGCCLFGNGNNRCLDPRRCQQQGGIVIGGPTTTTSTTTSTTTAPPTTSTTTSTTTPAPPPPMLGCTAGSQCESQCPNTTQQFCACGMTMTNQPVCYLEQNGCPASSFYCTDDDGCDPGWACVNLNDGCGGCDLLTQGKGICNPICTS